MKRTIMSMLGALAVAAGFSMFTAPAHAYTINCYPVTNSQTTYPYDGSAEKCGTSVNAAPTQKANGMAGALGSMKLDMLPAYNNLSNAHAKFRMFNNPTEYKTFFQERKVTPPSGTSSSDWEYPDVTSPDDPVGQKAWGVTYPLTPAPRWTAIFATNFAGVTLDSYANISYLTAHESGHWQDYFFKDIAGTNLSGLLSQSSLWGRLIAVDLENSMPPSVIDQFMPQCGTGGLFSGKTDFTVIPGSAAGGYYICNGTRGRGPALNNKYAGATNRVVLNLAYGDNFKLEREILSNETAFWESTTDDAPHGVMSYFDSNRFGCTKLLMQRVLQDGRLPTQSQMAAVVKPIGSGGGLAGCPVTGLPTN